MSQCRSCKAEVWWSETATGKRAPFNADGTNHFIDCPDRREWRKQPSGVSRQPGADRRPLTADRSDQPSLLDAPERPAESRYPD